MRAKILWVWNLRSDDDKVIRSAMDVRRVSCCVIVFVILLSALTAGSSGARKNDNGSSSLTLTINEDTVEKLWLYCRLDLMHIKDSLDSLPLLMKQILLDCIKKHNIEFHVYGESLSDTEIGYNKYLEFMFRWPDGSRRSLSSKLLEVAATPASAPGIPPLNLGPAPAPTGFQAPKPQPPSEAPRQPLLLPNVDLSTLPSSNEHSSDSPEISSSHVVSKKRHNEKVVIAVVVTATSTFLFATLLFYCYCKCRNRSGPGDGQKDEGPLLALSLSDYSTGSSRKSFALGNSSNKEKFGSSSFNNPSQNGKHPSSNSNLSVYSIESDIHKSSLAEGPLSVAFATVIRPSTEPSVAAGNVQTQPSKPPPGKLGPAPPPIPVDIKAGSRPPPPPPPPTGAPRPPPPPVGAPRPPPAPVGAPRPPPAPLGAPRPPPVFPIKSKVAQPSPLGPNHLGSGSSIEAAAKKTKLKPFFWDKVLANPDQSMVWHQISSGSFQFNEEMIETLFGHSANDKSKAGHKNELSSLDPSTQYIQIIDSKKAQNLSILLRALNVTTDEVCDALQEGNELPVDLLQTVLKMAPTAEEELKLRLYSGELSFLGPAERFLKVLVDIPFVFKRLDSLSLMYSFQEEVSGIKESLATLEVACKELRHSRLFLKLLEAVLKTGNRMNDGTFRGGAQAFKLDTLLKLADVKGTDGKTTLLHFVVQEIVRSEGVRAARAARESQQSISSVQSEEYFEGSVHESEYHYRSLGLQVISGLSGELQNVKKASVLDADGLTNTVSKLGRALMKSINFLNSEMKSLDEDTGFHRTLRSFVEHAEVDTAWLLEEEKRVVVLVKSTANYFHGNAGRDEGLRLFVIIRDFLIMLDKACKEVKLSGIKPPSIHRNKESPSLPPSPDLRQRLFPAIMDRRIDNADSDDESASP